MIRTQLITLLEIFHDLSFHFGVILENCQEEHEWVNPIMLGDLLDNCCLEI